MLGLKGASKMLAPLARATSSCYVVVKIKEIS